MLHVLTHSVPPRRSSDRRRAEVVAGIDRAGHQALLGGGDLFLADALLQQRGDLLAQRRLGRLHFLAGARRHVESEGGVVVVGRAVAGPGRAGNALLRSEEHTSELQSLMRISYAGFCLTTKKTP